VKRLSFLLLASVALAAPILADSPSQLLSTPAVQRAIDYLKATEPATIGEQIASCEIPAPSFDEAARAEHYRQRFTEAGLKNVRMDLEGNMIGERPGIKRVPTLVLAAHLDTVFPAGTDVRVRRDGNMLKGPGIGDDCRGLAVILAVARAMNEAHIQTRGTILFVADVGEEGLGNLRGVRYLLTEDLKEKPAAFITIDSSGLDIINREIGSRRYRITFRGPGGHSDWAFGLPSAIHAMGRAIDKISRFKVPAQPKTTFTVDRVEGGTLVDSIDRMAWMEVDLRSEGAEELAQIDFDLKQAVQAALEEENTFWSSDQKLTVEVQQIGVRAVGKQDPHAPVVESVLAANAALGIESTLISGGTDADVPVALGIPAIGLGGGGRWIGTHSLDESFDTTDSYLGTQRALLISLSIAGVK
jgi:tripeptide aminopeptidase